MISGWDFYFVKVLQANSEEQVFFPRKVTYINISVYDNV